MLVTLARYGAAGAERWDVAWFARPDGSRRAVETDDDATELGQLLWDTNAAVVGEVAPRYVFARLECAITAVEGLQAIAYHGCT
jgi:hypothetical protein